MVRAVVLLSLAASIPAAAAPPCSYTGDRAAFLQCLNLSIGANADAILMNTGDIASHASDIATNTAAIATNAGNTTTNAGNIATNAAAIATNAGDIASHASDIDDLYTQLGQVQQGNGTRVHAAVVNASGSLAGKSGGIAFTQWDSFNLLYQVILDEDSAVVPACTCTAYNIDYRTYICKVVVYTSSAVYIEISREGDPASIQSMFAVQCVTTSL